MDFFDILLAKKLEDDRDPTIEGLSVTENGTYSEEGKAYSPVIVEVPAPTLITKSITANGTYSASADNADGYSSVTVAVEGFKKKSIANTPTDIASFNDGTANPMPSLEISIEPVQSGSGDPSPSNVRPISGWSECNVNRTGKNLFDESTATIYSKWISTENRWVNEPSSGCFAFMCRPNTTYTISVSDESAVFRVGLLNQNPSTAPDFVQLTNVVRSTDKSPITITTNSDTVCIVVQGGNALVKIRNLKLQIEFGSTATTYSPYQGSTLSIPFHDNSDNPITVYGGTLNVTSGELRVTHANIASYNGETINEPWISSMDVYSAGTTPTTGAQVVYPLATPQTYQLTPTQVSTLLGQNNIFADCGQVLQGEYFVTL